VVDAVKEFYPYLYGFQFTIVTDYNPLTSLKDLNGQLVRWMLYLLQFHFMFQHHSGKFHGNANALSTVPNHVFPVLHQLAANLGTAQAADGTMFNLMKVLNSRCSLPISVAPGLKHTSLLHGI